MLTRNLNSKNFYLFNPGMAQHAAKWQAHLLFLCTFDGNRPVTLEPCLSFPKDVLERPPKTLGATTVAAGLVAVVNCQVQHAA